MTVIDYILSTIVFWMAWIIIPLLMEIFPAIGNFFVLLFKRFRQKKEMPASYDPEITLIIPVYNSADTLKACIASVAQSTYPSELIHIMLVNNESRDNSFEIYNECQMLYPELRMNWMNAKQGKSKALNLALFSSYGKYIIHIDSDGILHPDALRSMVNMFEQEPDTHCVTGTIMTNPKMIDETKNPFLRLFRKVEFFEYCQAFLAGRNFESEFNSIYTLSGAFSAFRKSAILKTQLYNTDTVCEDTHVTFQVREMLHQRVRICPKAIFYVDPIEGINQLYTQRQRWQRGELEVAHMFLRKKLSAGKGFFSNFAIRLLMYDHTFAFPRMIWYFALIFLAFKNYPMKLILMSLVVIYVLYVISALLYYINVLIFLTPRKEVKRYYAPKWYLAFLLPLFNFLVFWFRFAGIVNSISRSQTWRTSNLTEECSAFRAVVRNDFSWLIRALNKAREVVNNDEE